jgi:hypothetical protein
MMGQARSRAGCRTMPPGFRGRLRKPGAPSGAPSGLLLRAGCSGGLAPTSRGRHPRLFSGVPSGRTAIGRWARRHK